MVVSIARARVMAVALALTAPASAHEPVAPPGSPTSHLSNSARASAKIVDSFHSALRRGDANEALSYLSDKALIFEGGSAERSRTEYAVEHLGADAAYSKAVPGVITRRAGEAAGTLAWIATEGRTTGSFRGKPVDQVTTETMILRRIGGSWKIVHIHWSSAAARPRVAQATASILSDSVPAADSKVRVSPSDLRLDFSPAARLVEVTVDGPDGTMPMMVTPAGEVGRYSLPLPDLSPGKYEVHWRATSQGRAHEGRFDFTVE